MRGRYDLAQQSYYSGAAARRRDPMLVGELVPNPYPSPSPSPNPNPNPNPNQVEELVRAPRGMAAAPDFKFFVFGGHVAAIWYVQGRHTREECSAWCVVRGNECPTILVIPSMYHATLHPTDHAIIYCALTILAARYTRYDAEWTRRLDGHGCVCEGAAYCPPKGFLLQSFHKRSCKTTPRPEG